MSTHVNKVDRKGRVSVPAPFRATLAGQSFAGIVAFRSFRADAIEGCGFDRMEEIAARLETLPQFSEEYESLATIFADAQQLPFDGEGRIVLPDDLREHARIDDAVAFVGLGATFQLWQPMAFNESMKAARERARQSGMTLPPRRPLAGPGGAA